ncbi:AraC family transcriptional regulator [Achromobacter marplatensis]|uniref:AraC family transcriptional regulator with amidase-like domain n=1 Tax=Achromobacter marplatensis TaxID=470868 RepID=A0ABX9GH78_9BURK|nr:GlxA family transcriptional regulator [Achromobacter marplatensis]OWT69399.1 AraC family transcriptional regulator [Achromobacter marplatensis]RBP23929.1 AraC family transcriptional regulator with amidase-like domain [Achromobacter marplatensis]CAB3629423.1 HTH-type transcriptional regulator CdhR [Achromobacter marplatensis]
MQRMGFVVFPDFQVMGFAALTAFEIANVISGQAYYRIQLLSEHGGPIRASAGFTVDTTAIGRKSFDTVVIGAGMEPYPASAGILDFVRRSVRTARRVAAPCIGAFTLAEAGVLDGRRATTHWAFARELQARFPQLKVEEDRIFIIDGPVWTSAGMSAGIDLALAMVEKDLGPEVARDTARKLVVYHRRAGGQSQFSALLALEPKSDRIQKALDFAKQNLRRDLTVEDMANAASLSARQFSRAFRAETGQSPAKAVENLRVEAARVLMEQGRLSMDTIADETGFADRERMRRAFLRSFGQPPQAMRRQARMTG